MKEKFIYFLIIAMLFATTIMFYQNNYVVVESNKTNNNFSTNTLSINLETAAGSGIYEETTNSLWPSEGYTFNAELSKCENGSEISWNDTNKKVTVSSNKSDKCYVYFDKIMTFADYIIGLYTTQGANNLYHHDGTITATVANTDTGVAVGDVIDSSDGSYRYAGSSDTTNNYVCFGQDDEAGAYASGWCDIENLYRIIGVFNDHVIDADGNPTANTKARIKLIKSTLATSSLLGTDGDYYNSTDYYWNKTNYSLAVTEKGKGNLWSFSELNKTNLNKNYLNNLGTKWSDMIDESTWYAGGMTDDNGISKSTAPKTYIYELGESKNATAPYESYKAKVGLMYLSEYYYSADPIYWTYKGFGNSTNSYSAAKDANWLVNLTSGTNSFNEWTISPYLDLSQCAFSVSFNGDAAVHYVSGEAIGVRPTFSLKSSVTLAGGSGTESNPYRIN